MKKCIHILLISFATLVLVANNVVLQYVEKSSIVALDDQDDDEDKTEKTDELKKAKDFLSITTGICFQYEEEASTHTFQSFDINQLPSIFIDVELLPPNKA